MIVLTGDERVRQFSKVVFLIWTNKELKKEKSKTLSIKGEFRKRRKGRETEPRRSIVNQTF